MTSAPIAEPLASDIAAVQRVPGVRQMLAEVCAITGMGFAAVARVTEDRWIACLVLDQIEFGLDAGDELEIQTTICDEIRASGQGVFIDEVSADPAWRTHHTPAMYGFQSYVSIPIVLEDGSFFGTLCAIDPNPAASPLAAIVPRMEEMARAIAAAIVDTRLAPA